MKYLLIRSLYLILLVFATFTVVFGQDSPGVQVTLKASKQRVSDSEVMLTLKATLPMGARLFSTSQSSDAAPLTTIEFDSASMPLLTGQIIEKGNLQKQNDAALGTEVQFFADSVEWQQMAAIKSTDSVLIKGKVTWLIQKGEEYLPGEESFKIFVQPTSDAELAAGDEKAEGGVATQSLWWIFLAAFGGGLLALLTPCVYSMIPVTVSFFTKRSQNRKQGIQNALFYSASIVIIFTLLGFLITLIFGPAALNNLATNWIANIIFFLVFLIFGISFLGAFEIQLPSSWGSKADSKAGMGSFTGIFFMALTLVVVSFSCTGPIIGNLLVLAAKGSYWGPLTGMFGFSLALALPFALFAFFPSRLNILGKAGGWLNAVKVTLGFLELALALKFLSNADLVKGWRILDRETFIALWVVIFGLLGIYLLGKLKFSHDDELPKNDFGIPYLTVTRLFFAITALSFTVYMVPGLWGAPLKAISAFVPPMGTQDFNASSAASSTKSHGDNSDATGGGLPKPVKYYERMHIYEPEVVTKYGMTTYFDYQEALAIARQLKKPLMLDFTGINCVNCRKMEGSVWSDPEVMKRLKNDFVIASLYVDVQDIDLQENEFYYSKALNKQIETLGDKNADMQVTVYGANSQPYYFFLDANEKRLLPEGYGYDPDVKKFINLLETAKIKYQEGQK